MNDLVVGLHTIAGSANSADMIGRSFLWRGGTSGCRCIRLEVRRSLGLRNPESEGNDVGDVSLGTVYLNGYAETFSEETHGFETFLVVRSTTTNEDFDGVSDELLLVFLECADDALERGGDVREVGNATADYEDLSFGVRRSAGQEIN